MRKPPPNLNRRSFLAAATSTAAALAGCATDRSTHSTGIVDTHTHFYDPTRPEGVPWPPKDDPVLSRRVLPGDLKPLATPLGEDRVIYGSNWPVSERFAGYGTVLGIVRDYFSGKGSTAAAGYFSRNAARVYRFVRR